MHLMRRGIIPAEHPAGLGDDPFLADDIARVKFHRRDGIHVVHKVRMGGPDGKVIVPVIHAAKVQRGKHNPVRIGFRAFGQVVAQCDG